MLTGAKGVTNTHAPQATAPRGSHPQGGRKPEANSPEALRFREKLQEIAGGKHDMPHTSRNGLKGKPEDPGQDMPFVAPLLQPALEQKALLKAHDQSKIDALGGGQSEPAAQLHADAGADPVLKMGDAATTTLAAEFAAKFAERLALAPIAAGDTQLLLDPGRFSVHSVTISGGAGEDLSFAYESEPGDRDGSPDEQALRERLEARGIKVGSVARKI